MTVGSEDKKGAVLTMQEDGNLVLYNSKGEHLWSTDTYTGGDDIEPEHSVIEVEHIQSGIKSRVLSLEKPVNGCRMRE